MQAYKENAFASSNDDAGSGVSNPTTPQHRRIFSFEELDQASTVSSNSTTKRASTSVQAENTATQTSEKNDDAIKSSVPWLMDDPSIKKMQKGWEKGIDKKKKQKRSINSTDSSYDPKPESIKLSKATRHEHEVEAVIRQVMQRATARSSKEWTPRTFASGGQQSWSNDRTKEPKSGHDSGPQEKGEDAEPSASMPFSPTSNGKKQNHSLSLSETTQYLVTLQQNGEKTQNETDDLSHNQESNKFVKGDEIVERGSLERIVSMSNTLKAAAQLTAQHQQSQGKQGHSESTTPFSKRKPDSEIEIVFDVDQPHETNGDAAQHASSGDPDVETAGETGQNRKGRFSAFPSKMRHGLRGAVRSTAQEWSSLSDFFRPKRASLRQETHFFAVTVMFPTFSLAVILFYGFDNPPTGRCRDDSDNACSSDRASASWWLMFIGCRQVLVWILAKISDVFFIDFLILQHPRVVSMLGPGLSLLMVQSKGWPSQICWWGVWSLLILYGRGDFNSHWFFWQDFFGLWNKENPSGSVSSSDNFRNLIVSAFVVSVSVCLKRNIVGMHLGARLYARYNERLKESLQEILIISELSMWARRKRDEHKSFDPDKHWSKRGDKRGFMDVMGNTLNEKEDSCKPSGSLSQYDSDFVALSAFLEPWDEPKRSEAEKITGKQIIEFHQGVAVMQRDYMFSSAFGPVDTREDCIRSSEKLYHRLVKLMGSREESICLDDLAMWMLKGCQTEDDEERAEELRSLFHPDEDGQVHIIDFVAAIDEIYKKLRTLQHAIKNASDVSKSYERVINLVFYFLVCCAVLAIMGISPAELIVPLALILIVFGFMIGPGTSQLFDGVLLILVRQPYDIGDKVAISDVYDSPNQDGSTHWMITSIDLVKTTARLMGTAEVASFSNGSLAHSRIINMNRSNGAIVHVHVRFTIDVPYSTIMVFKGAVEKHIEDLPKEWANMMGFRTNRVEVDSNFVEYSLALKHQCAWQDLVAIRESKTRLESFCVEAQKQLGCVYEGPPAAVELTLVDFHPRTETGVTGGPDPVESIEKLMSIAETISPRKKNN